MTDTTDRTEIGQSPRRRAIKGAARELLSPFPEWVPPTPTVAERLVGIASGTTAGLASPVLAPVVKSMTSGLRDDSGAPDPSVDAGDPGWFGPDSVAWRVHSDPSLLVAGVAAFALQSLHPLAMAGVAEHSAFSEDFMGRTRRTAEFVQGVIYGSDAEARRLCRIVRNVHRPVVGVAPDGRPYAANDPDLLEWIHVAEYMCIAAANRRYAARPMTRAELDQYVFEVARVGRETGVIDPPEDWASMLAVVEKHRPNLAVAEYAAAGLSYLNRPPLFPDAAQPVWRVVWAGSLGCLPPLALRLMMANEPSTVERAACRAFLRTLAAGGGPSPALAAARARLAHSP